MSAIKLKVEKLHKDLAVDAMNELLGWPDADVRTFARAVKRGIEQVNLLPGLHEAIRLMKLEETNDLGVCRVVAKIEELEK